MKLAYLDFEFNGTAEAKLNLVSVAVHCTSETRPTYKRVFWLYEGANHVAAIKFFTVLKEEGYAFVVYTEAEARSLLSLDPRLIEGVKFIDLYLEYRCLLNHNYELAYGEQYIGGEVKMTKPPPPKWERTEENDNDLHHKPEYSLAAACFKMLGIKIDTQEKNDVRNIIISSVRDRIIAERDRIERYNASDILYLPALLNAVRKNFNAKGINNADWLNAATIRGDFSQRTARMLALGYPINLEKLSKFADNVGKILESSAKECLEVAPEVDAFRWCKKQQKYIANEKNIRAWAEAQAKPYWRKTDKKSISISKDAFNDWFDSDSEGFAGAYCRHLKTKQSLNGFMPARGKRKSFFEFVGQDGRVRPFLGIYGSQSSRSQPSATGFIPLKAHWLRTFIEAPPGKAICSIDYASQEFLIAAILSQDKGMMEAYASGDVYLAFAKDAGIVPKDATKASHKKGRDLAKATVLGISYDMSARGLAPRVAAASGEECTEERAQALIDKFYDAYPSYEAWKEDIGEEYRDTERLSLPDGWIMWGDNPNRRSVGNYPVQGHGAAIMRQAVREAQDCGLDVIYTLHDAVSIEIPSHELWYIETFFSCMQNAFQDVMKPYGTTIPIRLDGQAWSVDWQKKLPEPMANVHFMASYVDEKGEKDLKRYEQFFT